MKPTFKAARMSMIALPLALLSGAATAGGLAPVVNDTPAPTPVPVAPPPAPGVDWTGFYAGGQLGFGDLSADLGDADAVDDDETGALFGAHAGYLYDFGNIVLGGELDVDGTTIEPSITDAVADDSFEVDSVARAKILLGLDAGQFLPYVTGGAAQANVSSDTAAVDGDGDGTFVGAGVKYLVSDNLIVGGEVLQHTFDDFVTDTLDVEVTTATARVSFRF